MLLEEMINQLKEHRPEPTCKTCSELWKLFYELWYDEDRGIDTNLHKTLQDIVTAYLEHHKEHEEKDNVAETR